VSQNYGPQIVPSGGGFSYNVRGQIAEGFDRDSLIESLTNFRIQNRLTIGNPEKDVDESLMKRSTSYIPPMSKGRVLIPITKPTSLLDRVKAWLVNRKYGKVKVKYVDKREADRRAGICFKCPANKNWRSSCAPCVRTIEHDIVVVGQNHQTSLHNRMLACSIAGHDNSVAVWLDQSSLVHAKAYLSKVPTACWLKKIKFEEPKKKEVSAKSKLP
jgi:hypothetical protein